MERTTVNLNQRGAAALKAVMDLTEDSKTDCINRAVTIYAFIEKVLSEGGSVLVQESDSTEPQRLVIF
jgi:hypothetical protein